MLQDLRQDFPTHRLSLVAIEHPRRHRWPLGPLRRLRIAVTTGLATLLLPWAASRCPSPRIIAAQYLPMPLEPTITTAAATRLGHPTRRQQQQSLIRALETIPSTPSTDKWEASE